MAADGVERARERRRLGDDDVAGIDERAEGERQRLPGAVGDDDVLRVGLHLLEELVLVADQLAQAAVALGLAVGHGGGALGLHHVGGGLDHPLVRERGGIGIAAAELVEHGHRRPRGGDRYPPADPRAAGEKGLEGLGVRRGHDR